ncbi:hypothetical protein NDA13_001347 [Ustilago tritici]|nr:hypothetical protein NDA13_001347 [Ustilago tritici]
MPPCTRNSDTKSSDLSDEPHKERVPTAPHRQMLVGMETPSRYDSDDNNGDETHYNIDTISELNPEVLKACLSSSLNTTKGILSNWPAAMKHLNGTVIPEDKKLKKDLMKMEKSAELTLLNEVGKICTFQANVRKLITNINEHWAKAESMGHALPKILKVKMLIDQARYVTSYHHCIIMLEDTGMA